MRRMEKDVFTTPARDESLPAAQQRLEALLEKYDASVKNVTAILIAFEEMFINVSHYAYPGGSGDVTAEFCVCEDGGRRQISIAITDSGIPFNPLEKQDPDVTLPEEDRQIGGLGIYMVKKSMDRVAYEYRDGQNIFTMEKEIR